jgi:hypothetical protein
LLKIIFTLTGALFYISCTSTKNNPQKYHPLAEDKKIVADFDQRTIDVGSSLMGLSFLTSAINPEATQISGFSKMALQFGLGQIVSPLQKTLKIFLQDDTFFSCKEPLKGQLICQVTKGEKGPILVRAGLLSGDKKFALHFCGGKDWLNVAKNENNFWKIVTQVNGKSKNKSDLDTIYGKESTLPLNGLVLVINRKSEEIEIFRASIGKMQSTDERAEFLSTGCETYHFPRTSLETPENHDET